MHNLGVSVRVTSDSRQGGRKYMEDVICIEFHKSNVNDTQSIDFVYLAVFDGHGGKEAALFAKEHLLKEIMKNKGFWSAEDQQVLKAIRDGFISTHKLMWGDVGMYRLSDVRPSIQNENPMPWHAISMGMAMLNAHAMAMLPRRHEHCHGPWAWPWVYLLKK